MAEFMTDEERRAIEEAERLAREEQKRAQEEAARQAAAAQEEAAKAMQEHQATIQKHADKALERTMPATQEKASPGAPTADDLFEQTRKKHEDATRYERGRHVSITKHVGTAYAEREMPEDVDAISDAAVQTEQKDGYDKITVDMRSVKSDEQAFYFASSLYDDESKYRFLRDYAKYYGKDADGILDAAELMLGERLFSQPIGEAAKKRAQDAENAQKVSAYMAELADIQMLDLDGSAFNPNAADFATLWKATRLIADSQESKRQQAILKELAKTPGSKFYGTDVSNLPTGYLDNGALTKDKYNDFVGRYSKLFRKNDEDDPNYLHERSSIEAIYAEDPYTRSTLLHALDKAYTSITDRNPADIKIETENEDAGQTPQNKEEKPGFIERAENGLSGFIAGLTGKTGADAAPQEKAEEGGEQDTQPAPAPASTPAPESEPASAPDPESTPAPQAAAGGQEEQSAAPETQGPAYRPQETQTDEAQETTYYAEDGASAMGAVFSGKYDRITGPGMEEIQPLLGSPTTQKFLGTLSELDYSRVMSGNEMSEYITASHIAAMGSSYSTLYDSVMSEDFPEPLRNDALLMMASMCEKADRLEEEGLLGGDKGLPLLERLIQTDKETQDQIDQLYAARDTLNQDMIDMRAQTQKRTEETIADARAAVKNGTASEEQRALYVSSIDLNSYEIYNDDGYFSRVMDADAFFLADENGASEYADSSVRRGLNARGVTDDADYQSALNGQMREILYEDAQIAHSFGETLDEFYGGSGGMSTGRLAERAASRMSRIGATLTDEETQALSQGSGIGMGLTAGASMRHGAQSLYLNYRDTLYMGVSEAKMERTAAVVQARYQNDYGAWGRRQYVKDIQAQIDSGMLTDEYAAALQKALDESVDVYSLGVDPTDFDSQFLKKNAEIRRDIRTTEQNIQKNGTENEIKWFWRISGMTQNALQAGIAAGGSLLTGSSALGYAAGYGMIDWGENMKGYLNQGYSLNSAKFMASANSALNFAVNYPTFDKILGQMGGKALRTGFFADMVSKNPAGPMKATAAIKAFAKNHKVLAAGASAAYAFAENTLDEAVKDEALEGMAGRWVENALGPIMQKIDAREEITASDAIAYGLNMLNPANLDIMGVADDVKENFKEAAISSALFSAAGAFGAGVNTYRGPKLAYDVATGRSTDVAGAVEALKEDVDNPQFVRELDDAAEQEREDLATMEEMIGGADKNANMRRAAEAGEQAASHKAKGEASLAAMDASIEIMDEEDAKMAQGDVSEATIQSRIDATEAYVKNKTGYDEHVREQAQKQQEADEAFQARKAEARQSARAQIAREDARLRDNLGETRMQIAAQNGVIPVEGVSAVDFANDIAIMGEDVYTTTPLSAPTATNIDEYDYAVPNNTEDLKVTQNATGYANAPEYFAEAVAAWDGEEKNLQFALSDTPDVLRGLGIPDGRIVLLSEKLAQIKKKHKGMNDDVIRRLPEIVKSPVVVMKSKTVQGRVTMFGEVQDKNGAPVLAILSVDPEKNYVSGLNYIRMNSAYGKDTDTQGFINRSDVLYVDKKRAHKWEDTTRLQLPFASTQDADSSMDSVAPEKSDVKARKQDSDDAERILKKTSENRKKVKNVEQIARKFSKKIGVGSAIGTNRFDIPKNDLSDALGYYYGRKRFFATRVTEANSLQTVFHEVGHAVQEQLGIKGNKQMRVSWVKEFSNVGAYDPKDYDDEAFAEFFWRWMRSDEEAADFAGKEYIDGLTEQLRARGLLKDVQNVQNEVRNLLSQDAMTRLGAMIVDSGHKDDPGGVREKLSSTTRKMITDFVDANFPAEAVNDTIRDITKKNDVHINFDLRAQARLRDSAMDRASSYLTGELITDGDGEIVGASLSKRLADAGVSGKDFDDFITYWVACATLDRETKRNYDAYTIQFNEETNEVEVMKENKQTKEFATISKDIVSKEDLKAMITQYDQEKPQFKLGVQAIQAFNHDIMMAYMVKPGRMKQEQLLTMESMYPHYAPLRTYDVLRAKGQKGQGRTFEVQRIKGSTQTKINPMDSYVSMVNAMVLQDADNRVKQTVSRVYDRFKRKEGELGEGIGYYFREVKEAGGGNNIISVLEDDGTKRYFQILDPELMSLFAGNRNMETGLDMLGKLTRSMSRLTTGMNPFFGIRNFLKDFQSSVNYGTWATTYLDGSVKWLKTAWEVWQGKSDDWNEYVSMGGGGGTRLKSGTKKSNAQYRAEMFDGYEKQNIGKFKYAGKKLWALVTAEKLNEVIEQTSRFVEYKLGGVDRSTQEGRQRAFINAQDVTVDFGRRGRSAAATTAAQVIPFFNAGLQGMYRTARQFSKAEADRSMPRFIKTVANTALASAVANALCMRYLDDDEKEEYYYLSDDLKSKHFYIPNFWPDIMGDVPLIRIPIEQGVVAYGVNAAVSNAMWGKNADNEFAIEWAALGDTIVDGFTPVGSTIFDPVISIATNKNWYGSNIVPTYMSDYEAPAQYTEETADLFVWASEKLYNATGGKAAVSPMMIQYMAEQYTGYVGQTVIPFISKNEHTGEMNGLDAVAGKLRKTLTSDPLKSNDVVSPVYDNFTTLSGIQKAGNDGKGIPSLNPMLNDRQVRRAVDEAYDLTHSGGELYEAKKQISALYGEIDEIVGNERLSDSDKNALVEKKRREMIDIALDANRVMAEYREAYMTGPSYLTRLLTGFASLDR